MLNVVQAYTARSGPELITPVVVPCIISDITSRLMSTSGNCKAGTGQHISFPVKCGGECRVKITGSSEQTSALIGPHNLFGLVLHPGAVSELVLTGPCYGLGLRVWDSVFEQLELTQAAWRLGRCGCAALARKGQLDPWNTDIVVVPA